MPQAEDINITRWTIDLWDGKQVALAIANDCRDPIRLRLSSSRQSPSELPQVWITSGITYGATCLSADYEV
jgi:hypothetical protein